jgi:DNA-binding CsgD family transcriptional regulator/PAS domain-containing protein
MSTGARLRGSAIAPLGWTPDICATGKSAWEQLASSFPAILGGPTILGAVVPGEQALSDLIGRIYDCAIDPALWDLTLRCIAEFLNSRTIDITILRPVTGAAPLTRLLDYGSPPGSQEVYFEKYSDMNPLIHAGALYEVDEVFTAREALGDEILRKSRMYREWAVPNGMLEVLCANIRKDTLLLTSVSATRRELYNEAEKARLRLLLPHLRRSLTIAQLIGDAVVARDRFQELVDGLAIPVFIVDARGFIRHANAPGERLLTGGQALRSRNGRLTCFLGSEQAALIDAIKAGDRGERAVPLTAADGARSVATLLPLANGYRREASGATFSAAAVFVHDPAGPLELPGEIVGKFYKLTGAELQLLMALTGGASLAEAAKRFGVSRTTVKTHLERLFVKTGTSRQSELLRKTTQFSPFGR